MLISFCCYLLCGVLSVWHNVEQWGSTTGISDITSSAGWIILSCNSSAASLTTSNQTQVDVRLVCSSEDTSATGCDHLFANGAEGTLVRMPPQDSQNVCVLFSFQASFLILKMPIFFYSRIL